MDDQPDNQPDSLRSGIFRIEEKILDFSKKQDRMSNQLDKNATDFAALVQRVYILESKSSSNLQSQVDILTRSYNEFEKRIICCEGENLRNKSWWDGTVKFWLKIFGIVVAGYVLKKLGLFPPP